TGVTGVTSEATSDGEGGSTEGGETEASATSGATTGSQEGADTSAPAEASAQTTGGEPAKGATSSKPKKRPNEKNGNEDPSDASDEVPDEGDEQKVDDWGKRIAQILKPYRTAARECGKEHGLERGTLINVRLMLAPDGKIVRILPGPTTPNDAAFTCVKELIKDVRFAEKRTAGNVGGGTFAYSFKVY
ncbi:MAG: hypothetical protein ACPG77_17500, partial [Nannocystaceae bacterium]